MRSDGVALVWWSNDKVYVEEADGVRGSANEEDYIPGEAGGDTRLCD